MSEGFLSSDLHPYPSFSCQLATAKSSNSMLSTQRDNGQPGLVPGVRGNAFSFTVWTMTSAVSLLYMNSTGLENLPCLSIFVEFGSRTDVGFCQKLPLHLWRSICGFWFFFYSCGRIYCILLSSISGTNPIWLWCTMFLISCFIQSARICSVFYLLCSSGILVCVFLV